MAQEREKKKERVGVVWEAVKTGLVFQSFKTVDLHWPAGAHVL